MIGLIAAAAEGALLAVTRARVTGIVDSDGRSPLPTMWPSSHTAITARHRLLAVVKADREAMPAWRWVCTQPRRWHLEGGWSMKRRFRWERRA